jgi:hypothetical protein
LNFAIGSLKQLFVRTKSAKTPAYQGCGPPQASKFTHSNPRRPTKDNEVNEEGLPAKDAKGRESEVASSFSRVWRVSRALSRIGAP